MPHPTITQFLITNNLEEAIKAMMVAAQQFDQGELYNDLILLSGRYHGLQRDHQRMMVEDSTYRVNMARLGNVALDYHNDLEIPEGFSWNGEAWAEGLVPEPIDDPPRVVTEPPTVTYEPEDPKLPEDSQVPEDPQEPKESGPKTILYLAASPTGEARIQGDREFREMGDALRRGRERDGFELLQPEFAVTAEGLIDALSQEPNVVHFSAHGEDEHLIFADEKNEAVEISFVALQRQFEQLVGITEFVVFNSCYSAEMAKELSKLGMYVSGNNLEILDEASINFVKGLYTGLGNGKTYERAFNDALTMVTIMNPDEVHIMEIWKDGEKLDI